MRPSQVRPLLSEARVTMAETWKKALFERMDGRPNGHLVFALIDMAGLSHLQQAPEIFAQIKKGGAVSVLQDERPDALRATPWLLPLHDGVAVNARMLFRTTEWALRGPAVTWIISPLPLNVLAQRLRLRTEAELPGNQPILLRHFDPRVLPELAQVLHQSQREAFLSMGGEWLYLDRTHALQSIALANADEVDPFDSPWLMDDHQFAALLAASEVDQLMPELARATPMEFMRLSAAQRVEMAHQALKLAASWHLTGLADQTTVGMLLLKLGEGFHLQPNWAPWVKEMVQRRMGLIQAVERATTEQAA